MFRSVAHAQYRPGRRPNERGAGVEFGPDVSREFLQLNKLSMVVRSHECVDNGWESWHDDTVFTVFSASNYTGGTMNDGAYAVRACVGMASCG